MTLPVPTHDGYQGQNILIDAFVRSCRRRMTELEAALPSGPAIEEALKNFQLAKLDAELTWRAAFPKQTEEHTFNWRVWEQERGLRSRKELRDVVTEAA